MHTRGSRQRTVLITGCSPGSLGHHLALAFHARGLRVIATARTISKLSSLAALGIDILPLDVTSPSSVVACKVAVSELTGGRLHLLINNAGGMLVSPVADVKLDKARELFELNFFSYITMTQAFLPLLMAAQASGEHGPVIIANHSSIAATIPSPWVGLYNASKAAVMAMTDTLRFEMEPFGIEVVELRSGEVESGIYAAKKRLPEGSLYEFARESIERNIDGYDHSEIKADVWAKAVVDDLLRDSPPNISSHGGVVFGNKVLGRAGYAPYFLSNMVMRWTFGIYKVSAAWVEQMQKDRSRDVSEKQ